MLMRVSTPEDAEAINGATAALLDAIDRMMDDLYPQGAENTAEAAQNKVAQAVEAVMRGMLSRVDAKKDGIHILSGAAQGVAQWLAASLPTDEVALGAGQVFVSSFGSMMVETLSARTPPSSKMN